MITDEMKQSLAELAPKEQAEVIAFLFQLRRSGDRDYQADISRRLDDRDSSHWLSPDEFERRLDQKELLITR